MSPKFRGNGEDWLDDEGSKRRSQSRAKKAPEARSVGLPLDQANGIVAEVFPNQCRVKLDQEEVGILCSYRRAHVVSKSKTEVRERSPVAVGDRVLAKKTGDSTGVIEGICIRRNSLSRPAPGREAVNVQHVLAANVDFLVIVASAQEPLFSSGLVDRFLVASEAEGISPLLCITKMDLWESGEKPWAVYRDLGYDLFEVSIKKDLGVDDLQKKLEGHAAVFCGHSGVGKTSLLRDLLKVDIGKIGEVNELTGKGRHTTTGAVLLGGPQNSQWIDTPGVRGFGLSKVPPESLALYFPEFRKLQCSQIGCLHQEELGCLAQSLERYSSYRRILESLIAGEN